MDPSGPHPTNGKPRHAVLQVLDPAPEFTPDIFREIDRDECPDWIQWGRPVQAMVVDVSALHTREARER
jgi:hypothetical protein